MHKKQVFSPPLNNGAIPESLGLQIERKERILCKARAHNRNHGRERYSCVKGALKSWRGWVQHVEKFLRDNNLVRAGHILFGTQRKVHRERQRSGEMTGYAVAFLHAS